MKLLTYESAAGPRAGVLVEDRVVDVATLLGEAGGVRDVRALLELPGAPLDRLKAALAGGATEGLALGSVRLRAPILQPPTVRDHIIYEEHATQQHTREISESWYRLPVFYFSNPLRIFGPDETVPYPAASQRLDYELELGAVIGRDGSDILEAEAEPYIAGFTIFNDWSCRDLQTDEMKFGLGPAKGKDAANSLGPWVVTSDELAPHWRDGRLHLKCAVKVNGVQWMEGNAGAGISAGAPSWSGTLRTAGSCPATSSAAARSRVARSARRFARATQPASSSLVTWSRWRSRRSGCCATRLGRSRTRTRTSAGRPGSSRRCRRRCH